MEKKFLDVDFQDIGSAKISEIEFETLKKKFLTVFK
jgi:hypothetical protein